MKKIKWDYCVIGNIEKLWKMVVILGKMVRKYLFIRRWHLSTNLNIEK